MGFIGLGAAALGISMIISFGKALKIMTRDTENEEAEETEDRNNEATQIQFAGFVNAIGCITYLMLLAGYGRNIVTGPKGGEEFCT